MINPLSKAAALCLLLVLVSACTTTPPRQSDNICSIFKEKSSWYKKAQKAEKRWGSPIAVNMAIMHQESRFRAKAKPPRRKILGFIPGPRKSSAYGYSQAKDSTWKWYKKSSGRRFADRDEFGDAIDFIAWYNRQSQKTNGIKSHDTYRLYLAYHEGHGGFRRGSFNKKAWLKNIARKVNSRANTYQRQLKSCEKQLSRRFWLF